MTKLRILVTLRRNIQAIYFWIFVMVLMVPNFFILDIAPKPLSAVVPYIFIPLAFYIFFMALGKKPGAMIFFALPFIFVGAFQLVLMSLSRSTVIGADMFTNIYTTNASEAGDVLKTLAPVLIGITLLYGGAFTLGWFSLKTRYNLPEDSKRRAKITSGVVLAVGLLASIIPSQLYPRYAIYKDVFPINVIVNFGISGNRWVKSKNYMETSKDFTFGATKPLSAPREVYLLIIGESSRADKWELFGYGRATNPLLREREDELVLFSDAVSQSNTTHKSTALLMSSVDATGFEKVYCQKSMVAAFREAGFKTLFVSNQGANGSFMDFYASQADERVDMPKRKLGGGECVGFDHETIPHIRKFIDNNDGNLFIVIHTYGSHLQFVDRYTKEFEIFTPAASDNADVKDKAQINNAYDNTILYTDNFVNQVITMIDSLETCSSVTYISDHGEDLFDDYRNRFLHSSPTLTYYQLHVPYLFWFSDGYKMTYSSKYNAAMRNKDKAVSSSSLFHTLVDMAGIETSYKREDESVVSSKYAEKERMFLDDRYEPVEFYNTGLDSIDFRLFREVGIKYNPQKVQKTF